MKKALVIVLPLLISTAALAQQEQGGLQGAQVQPNSAPPQDGQGPGRAQNFQEMKQRLLERIDQRRNCIAQAQDPQALRACRPQRENGSQPRQ